MIISCGKQETGKTLENMGIQVCNVQEVKEAYEYAKNLSVWDSVLVNELQYNSIAKAKIHEDEILKVYREKAVDSDTNEEMYIYYFKGKEKVRDELLGDRIVDCCSSLDYYINKKVWGTMFGMEYMDSFEKKVSEGKIEFIGELNMVYSNTYIPKVNYTDYKGEVLKKIKRFIKNYLKETTEKGEYQIFVKDFSDADKGTKIMIQNSKKEIDMLLIHFLEYSGEEISVASFTNVLPEFKEDYSLGGIKYSELFSKLCVDSYNEKN